MHFISIRLCVCVEPKRALETNKQVLPSSICKYNLLRKADTLLGSLYRPGKASRILRVQELRYRKYMLHKKANLYDKLERKWQSRMASARPMSAIFQELL